MANLGMARNVLLTVQHPVGSLENNAPRGRNVSPDMEVRVDSWVGTGGIGATTLELLPPFWQLIVSFLLLEGKFGGEVFFVFGYGAIRSRF